MSFAAPLGSDSTGIRRLERTETVLEQRVGTLQLRAQAPNRGGTMTARERLGARVAEKLPVHADERARGDLRVERVRAELDADRIGEHASEPRHHLELLCLQ